jgi:hypothetical protein
VCSVDNVGQQDLVSGRQTVREGRHSLLAEGKQLFARLCALLGDRELLHEFRGRRTRL